MPLVPSQPLADAVAQREQATLAPYAMRSADSAGRKQGEPPHPYRGPFQRDRDRIVHCAAFRRLSSKTQVFTGDLGDYHRTRLTHTLEVASIARTLARAMRLNEDLVEALALMHDIGHPPFGHAGEAVLHECMQQHGGFNHNCHALRIVEHLEQGDPRSSGLNLSAEVLEGQRLRAPQRREDAGPQEGHGALLEVQVVDAADSIAYDTHDADDALELGLIEMGELLELPLWKEAAAAAADRFATLSQRQLRRIIVRDLIERLVSDMLAASTLRIAAQGLDSVAAVRRSERVVHPSHELAEQKAELEGFLYQRVYRHPEILAQRKRAQDALRGMFVGYLADIARLPEAFQLTARANGAHQAVTDYLASLTDRSARQEFERG